MLSRFLHKARKSLFIRDVILTVGAQLFIMVIALVINKIMSVYLQPSDYAIYSIALKSINVLAFCMLLGLGIALPRYLASMRAKGENDRGASFILASLVLLTLSTTLIATFAIIFKTQLSSFIFNDTKYEYLIVPSVVMAASIAISGFVYSYFRGIDKFKFYNLIQVVFQLLVLIIVILCGADIAAQLSLRGEVVLGLSIAVLAVVAWKKKTQLTLSAKLFRGELKELASFCLPRVPGEIFLFGLAAIPLILINAKFGTTVAAGFATAITLNSVITPLFQFAGSVMLPYVSKGFARGETDDIGRKLSMMRFIYIVMASISVVIMWLFTDVLIRLLFSDAYIEFAGIVRVVHLLVIPFALYLLLRNPLDAVSKIPYNTINLGVSLALLLIFIFFAPNIFWASVAFPVAYLLLGLLSEFMWFRVDRNAKQKKVVRGDKRI